MMKFKFMWQCDPNSPPGFAMRKPCPGKLLLIQSTIRAPMGVFVGLPMINALNFKKWNFGILNVRSYDICIFSILLS